MIKKRILRISHTLFFLAIAISFAGQGCGEKQTGPIISEYSDIYKVGDQWHCPICDKPVQNGDRSEIDPALHLSEWHDAFLDPEYFTEKINHISDEELIASLDLADSNKREMMNTSDTSRVSASLKQYFADRLDHDRLYHYDDKTKIPFIPVEEFQAQVKASPDRMNEIIEAGYAVAPREGGYTIAELHFGNQVDFNSDWPVANEFSVNYLPVFVDLLNAYLASEDPHFARSFEDLFNQWYEQRNEIEHKLRPEEFKHRNVIWYELGLGVRLPRIIDSYRVHSLRLDPETHKRVLKTVLGSARWLYQCLINTPFHPYNWQTQTAMTLAYAAFIFPEFKESVQWLEASRKNMVQHFQKDILDDGGYVERTGSYTNYVFGMFYRYMLMFQFFANDESYLTTYLQRLERMMEFTALTATPVGVNSPFNDSRRGTYLADLLIEMADFFNRGDFLGAVKSRVPDTQFASLKARPETPSSLSVNFEESGFVVMRDGWQPESYFTLINYGPLKNHGHYDILDFEIFANGIPIAVDPGLGLKGYTDPLHVSWYKQSRSHNMLTVDDAIVNKRGISGEETEWANQTYCDYFAATHRGYEEFHDTLSRRHFAFVKGNYWLILDEIDTPHRGKILDWNFHTPLHMGETSFGFVSEESPGAAVLFVQSDSAGIEMIKKTGPADLRGIKNEEPNREIDWLIFRKRSAAQPMKDRFAILVTPFDEKSKIAGSGTRTRTVDLTFEKLPLTSEGPIGFRMVTESFEDWVIFSDGEHYRFTDELEGDFVFGWFRLSESGLSKLSAVNASQIYWMNDAILEVSNRQNIELAF